MSDESEYLCEEFQVGQIIVFYRLDELEQLPEKLKRLLEHPQEAQSIADAAYKKAAREHTWEQRAVFGYSWAIILQTARMYSNVRNCQNITCAFDLSKFPYAALSSISVRPVRFIPPPCI